MPTAELDGMWDEAGSGSGRGRGSGTCTARIPLVDGLAHTYELFHYSLPAEVQVVSKLVS